MLGADALLHAGFLKYVNIYRALRYLCKPSIPTDTSVIRIMLILDTWIRPRGFIFRCSSSKCRTMKGWRCVGVGARIDHCIVRLI